MQFLFKQVKKAIQLNWNINYLKKKLFVLIIICCFYKISIGQVIIKGYVFDQNKKKLENTSIVVKDSLNTIINYTFSNTEGFYMVKLSKLGNFNVQVSKLGYETKTIPVNLTNVQNDLSLNVILREKSVEINEVIVQAKRPITIKDDTISFVTRYFSNGTEQNAKELLSKIPGIQIDREGTIRVGGQEIEKLLVDNEDIFGKGYKIVSNNMPAFPIEEVEILKNYTDNRFLKGIKNTDKVALNLKLKDSHKNLWFGNVNPAIWNKNSYEIKSNIMNFSRKNKFYFIVNKNNIGYDATGDVNQFISNVNSEKDSWSKFSVNQLVKLSPPSLGFTNNRTNFNNASLVSLNSVIDLNDRLKIKIVSFFNLDKINFYRQSVDHVNFTNISFNNIENVEYFNNYRIALGELILDYNVAENKTLNISTLYNYRKNNDGSNLIFNDDSMLERLTTQANIFNQKITHTIKLNDNSVLMLNAFLKDEKLPQQYSVNNYFFKELFPEFSDADSVIQKNETGLKFYGGDAVFTQKFKRALLELDFGFESLSEKMNNLFSIYNSSVYLASPSGYMNKTTIHNNNIFLKSKYSFSFKNISLSSFLNFYQKFNKLKNNSFAKFESPFFVTPGINFKWNINSKNTISSNYSFDIVNNEVRDAYSNYILTSFRTFNKGTGNLDRLASSRFLIHYSLGNWLSRYFVNSLLIFIKKHDYYTWNTTINQNYLQSEKILVKNGELLIFNTKIDYFIGFLSSNIKLDFQHNISELTNSINSKEYVIASNTNIYGLELKSIFKGMFNFHVGTKWMTSKIIKPRNDSYTKQINFLDIILVLNDNVDLKLKAESFQFDNMNEDPIYFIDFDLSFKKFLNNRLTFSVRGRNLLNTNSYKTYQISEIGWSTNTYRLLPRFVLLSVNFRFP
ncbi:MAG: hypothetical protein PWR03_382 [Tenuifilum sp.]|nr:hypothetical protein [Tenuifilum sp.]